MEAIDVNNLTDKKWVTAIGIVSAVVVLAVAFLIYHAQGVSTVDSRIYFLPKFNAFLNGSVSILLISGFFFIKNQNVKMHRLCMLSAFVFSSTFLVSYIIYHYCAPETHFGGEGIIRLIYFFLLITHILLAISIVPLTLLTLYRIWKKDIVRHKKIAKWTFPIWLYVSITGVVVYLLISPYYPV